MLRKLTTGAAALALLPGFALAQTTPLEDVAAAFVPDAYLALIATVSVGVFAIMFAYLGVRFVLKMGKQSS